MVDLQPFRGLRFDPARVGDVGLALCPPYDVISPAEQAWLLEASPCNVVRVELPREEDGLDRYAAAAATLDRWRAEGVLVRDAAPAFYLHELSFPHGGDRLSRRALIAALRLEPWEAGAVRPHERTMSAPKEDRFKLMRAVRANVSPLMTLYRERAERLDRAWALARERSAPLLDARMPDGTAHRIWGVTDPELVAAIQGDFADRPLYIADGHHRYETALRYRDEVAAGGSLPADHPASFAMAQVMAEDDPGMVILPTHRLLRGLGLDHGELEVLLSDVWHAEYFPVWEGLPREQQDAFLEQLHTVGQTNQAAGLYGPDPSIFTILTLRDREVLERRRADRSAAWRCLDVSLVDEALVQPVLERAGAERDAALSFERDPYAAMRAVQAGEQELAVLLNPTKVQQVLDVADAGDRMPEKSTYFHPKPPTGLVLRPLEP